MSEKTVDIIIKMYIFWIFRNDLFFYHILRKNT